MKRISVCLAVLLAGCAQLSPPKSKQPASPEASVRLQQGLARYRESRYDDALVELNAAVSSGRLKSADDINARKHIAFIHCASNREAQCREQFQAIVKADPAFDLAANEANHPAWGPVWRSIKVVTEDQRTVDRGSRLLAGAALQKLAEGIREYDAGRYKQAAMALQAAVKSGLKEKSDEIRAQKYSAFSYCLLQDGTRCRDAFRAIFALDPAFELAASEAGHPSWAGAYRKELAAARRANKLRAAGRR